MSIADLKTRLHDVPGIETLTMQMLAGRQNYALNGRLISVDGAASDSDVESAIRAAIASPAIAQMPAGTPMSAGTPASGGTPTSTGTPMPPTPSLAAAPAIAAAPVAVAQTVTPAAPAFVANAIAAPAAVATATSSPTPAPAASAHPASAGLSVKQMLEEHTRVMGQIQAAQVELLRSSLARQRDAVSTAVGNVATKIDGQTDDFLAIMGQFTNDLGV